MKSLHRFGYLVLTCAVCLGNAARISADEPSSDPPATADTDEASKDKEEDSDDQKLFDGKSLENWEEVNYGGQGSVLVEEGVLVIERGEPFTGVVWKGDKLPTSNYEITCQAQRRDGNDFFLALTFPVADTHCTLVLGGWGGGVVGLSNINGSDASENVTTKYVSFKNDKWYDVRVRVTDSKIQAWLGDRQLADVNYLDNQITLRIEMEVSKPLGLTTYQTIGAVRDLKLKPMTETQKEADSKSE